MDRFGLIGFPISHSQSPAMFARAYGGRFAYDLIETPDFEEAMRLLANCYKAVNVTAPFKIAAAKAADHASPEVGRTGAANILVNTPDGIWAYNSDYLAVRKIILDADPSDIAVVGFGGAGKAALAAAQDCGIETRLYRHDGIADGISADLVIYTLPSAVPGIEKIGCRALLEANYKDPCLTGRPGYIPGTRWHMEQALAGFPLMTGEPPTGLL